MLEPCASFHNGLFVPSYLLAKCALPRIFGRFYRRISFNDVCVQPGFSCRRVYGGLGGVYSAGPLLASRSWVSRAVLPLLAGRLDGLCRHGSPSNLFTLAGRSQRT